jgi:AAA family ATP:ADP antiporter
VLVIAAVALFVVRAPHSAVRPSRWRSRVVRARVHALRLRAGRARHLAVWSFYLFGDLFSTIMVAAFFAFLNDTVSPDAARRL